MFMLTLGKRGLRRAGVVVLCGAVLCGAVLVGRYVGTRAVSASAEASTKIESTQDIQTYFTGFGLEVDPAAVTADKVSIPRKWDDSFSAFNVVVGQSGRELTKYKGKTVEKWQALIPSRSTGDTEVYGVLLVYKKKAVGAYLLEKPSGEVTGLADAVKAAADAGLAGADEAVAGGPAAEASGEIAADGAAEVSGAADGAADDQNVSLTIDLPLDSDGYPVE